MNTILGAVKLGNILGVTRFTVYNYCKQGMPYLQKDRRRIFELDKVQEWMINDMK